MESPFYEMTHDFNESQRTADMAYHKGYADGYLEGYEKRGAAVSEQLLHEIVKLSTEIQNLKTMLKEREPKTGHWIFESQYCEMVSHTCSECGRRLTTRYDEFGNYCWYCGTKMEVRKPDLTVNAEELNR